MRDIRFRAWNKEDKEMLYDVEKTYDYGCRNDNKVMANSFADVLEDERYEVMQFTRII